MFTVDVFPTLKNCVPTIVNVLGEISSFVYPTTLADGTSVALAAGLFLGCKTDDL